MKNEEILIKIVAGEMLCHRRGVSLLCVSFVAWPGGMLQGNPAGIDILFLSVEIRAFKIFSLLCLFSYFFSL